MHLKLILIVSGGVAAEPVDLIGGDDGIAALVIPIKDPPQLEAISFNASHGWQSLLHSVADNLGDECDELAGQVACIEGALLESHANEGLRGDGRS